MAAEVDHRKSRFIILQKRLKEERLYVKQEKDIIKKLNDKLMNLSHNLFCLDWKNRHYWNNVDQLVGGRVNPPECSATSKIIDNVQFEDGASYLNYEDIKYGEFLSSLRENQRLVALILDFCDNKRLQPSARNLTRLFISTLYGGCVDQVGELKILLILKELMNLQVLTCEDLLGFFCGKRSNDNAFACVLTIFSEMLFSSKLYLTAALHGTVMQVIVDDAIFLDVEVTKIVSRIPPKATLEKFGHPGSAEANEKIKQHMDGLHKLLVQLTERFLKSLHDKIYCFPQSLRWAIGKLYQGMVTKMKLPHANAKAIIGYMLMSYFICPAIINPEPYGINSDADISETARHNLGQIASILRSLALLECGLKDEKLKNILQNFEQGMVMSYVTKLLNGAEDIDLEDTRSYSGPSKCSLMVTEHDLQTLIQCLRLLQSCNFKELADEGLDELLDNLPSTPQKWEAAAHAERDTKSMPRIIQLNPDDPPPPLPRHKKLRKVNTTGVEASDLISNKEEMDRLREMLTNMIKKDEPVLVIPLGNDTRERPGSLSEEKVLGFTKDQAPYDPYTTREEKQRRTSTLMLTALQGAFTDDTQLGTSISNSFESLSSCCEVSYSPVTEMNIIKSKSHFEDNQQSDPIDSIFFNVRKEIDEEIDNNSGSNTLTPKSAANIVPVDNLLNLNDDDEAFLPQLPEKKHHRESISDTYKNEPLINLDNEIFQKPTSLRLNEEKSTLKNHRISVFSDPSGFNAILQAAAVPSPTTVRNSEFQDPWSPSVFAPRDPWGAPLRESRTEDFGFENSFNPPESSVKEIPPSPRRSSPSAKKKLTIDQKYAEYSENIQREQKNLSQSLNDTDFEETGNKFFRKKSHSAWFRDKFSNKFGTGLKTIRVKAEANEEEKMFVRETNQTYTKLNRQTSANIKKGTPAEADEFSKSKSMSIISRGSGKSITDESEAILAKYRNLTLDSSNTTGLSDSFVNSSTMEPTSSSKQEEVTFDEQYKFNDAKRKLRIVLCSCDRISLPHEARTFDILMMTVLQCKLAEAINLQDRYSVAQLHETLRSIKQLPRGSCQNLIEKLEEEYKQRAKYISYLTKCKQGLLSAISHIEQVIVKMERDRLICRKYFTSLSVRLFLENSNRKRRIIVFAQRFASTKMLDEKCALLNDFLEELYSDMLKDPTWTYCNDEQIMEAQAAIERAIMSKIYKEAFYPNSETDIENDRIFCEHIKHLSAVITVNHPALQIPKMYQKEAPWTSAQTELLMVNAYKTAADKLACIHRCSVTIMNLLSMASEKQAQGADDFLPVLVYVVIKANPPNLLSTKQYVNTFYETRLSGEQYYCWMQFCSAIEFIKTVRVSDE